MRGLLVLLKYCPSPKIILPQQSMINGRSPIQFMYCTCIIMCVRIMCVHDIKCACSQTTRHKHPTTHMRSKYINIDLLKLNRQTH